MEIRFSADGSLGRLARWLRLLGWDTAWERGDSLRRALLRARSEGRILLTRSSALERSRGTPPLAGSIRVTANDLAGQLLQVDRRWPVLDAAAPLRRCAACNLPLEPIPAERARPLVPPFVARTQERFRRCSRCGRIYWEATHAAAILRFARTTAARRENSRREPAGNAEEGEEDEEDAGPDRSSPAP